MRFSGDLELPTSYPELEPRYVVHLAAKVDKVYWDSDSLRRVNVEGTRHLIERYPSSKFIFSSSSDVDANRLTPYAQSKLDAEKIVLQYPENLVIRSPVVIGPCDPHRKLAANLYRRFLFGEECSVSEGPKRTYVLVDDLIDLILQSLDSAGVMKIAGDEFDNVELADMIRRACREELFDAGDERRQVFYEGLKRYAREWRDSR